jgi:hydroxyquinol 1,2-dioxygenase
MAAGIDRNSITDAVIASFAGAGDARTREVMAALVRHLHDFAREVDLRPEEWRAAVAFLTDAARITDEARNEFVLASDVLGFTSLTDLLRSAPGATPRSVLGPVHAEGAPARAPGAVLAPGRAGQRVRVHGRVLDVAGSPVPGAVIDFWQADAEGRYWQQDPTQTPEDFRFRMRAGEDGAYAFETVRPAPYTVPYDGPVGRLLRALGRHAWRPAHFHFRVEAPGFAPLTTEVFPEDDPYLAQDAVFGVREALVARLEPVAGTPALELAFDFRLARAE